MRIFKLLLLVWSLGYYPYVSSAQNWTAMGPFCNSKFNFTNYSGSGAGQIHCFAFSKKADLQADSSYPYRVYAGGPWGGLWESDNYGNSWLDLNEGFQTVSKLCSVADIAVDQNTSSNAPTLYVASGYPRPGPSPGQFEDNNHPPSTGIFVSTNGGKTFAPTGVQFDFADNNYIARLVMNTYGNNPEELFAATSQGLLKTENGFKTYKTVMNDPDIFALEISPDFQRNRTVYAAGDDIWYSTDGGNSFRSLTMATNPKLNALLSAAAWKNINIKVKNINGVDHIYVFMAFRSGNANSTAAYHYDGNSWSTITTGLELGSKFGNLIDNVRIKMDVNVTGTFEMYTGVCIVNKITDVGAVTIGGGYNQKIHADIHAIDYIPGSNNVLVGTDGGVFFINGATGAVSERNKGFNLQMSYVLGCSKTDPCRLAIGNQDTGSDNLNEDGWSSVMGCDGDFAQLYDNSNPNRYFTSDNCGGGQRIELIDENLQQKKRITFCPQATDGSGGPTHFKQDPDNSDVLYASANKGPFRVSMDFGATWELLFTLDNNFCKDCYFNPGELGLSSFLIGSNNKEKYCYVTTLGLYTSNESFVFWNPDFSNAPTYSPCNAKPQTYTGWRKIYLPTNSSQPDFNFTFNQSNQWSVTGVAADDNEPNTIWLCYGHWNKASQFKVIKMTYDQLGGNWSWVYDQDGLPDDVQCTNIVYEKNSNDALYLGTNRGMYYKNAALNRWIPFQQGLPYVCVTDVDINYCSGQIRAATYGRGVYTSDLYRDKAGSDARIISSDEHWSSSRDIGADIIIKSKKRLSIDPGVIINMCKDCKIVVEPGARLNIDNGTITNLCGEFWDGIYVMGRSDQPQTSVKRIMSNKKLLGPQGIVDISNGSSLSYMVNGIVVGKKPAAADRFYDASGPWGQVIAIGSHFRNDFHSIVLEDSMNTDASKPAQNLIKDCDSDNSDNIGTQP